MPATFRRKKKEKIGLRVCRRGGKRGGGGSGDPLTKNKKKKKTQRGKDVSESAATVLRGEKRKTANTLSGFVITFLLFPSAEKERGVEHTGHALSVGDPGGKVGKTRSSHRHLPIAEKGAEGGEGKYGKKKWKFTLVLSEEKKKGKGGTRSRYPYKR